MRNIESLRKRMQRRLADQICPHTRKLTFGKFRKFVVQCKRYGAVENAVADKFEALVVRRTEATMCQCLTQQAGLAKGVTECSFQAQVIVCRSCARLTVSGGGCIEVKQQAHVARNRHFALIGDGESYPTAVFADIKICALNGNFVNISTPIK